jgi:FtsH-binding integral membrane protein
MVGGKTYEYQIDDYVIAAINLYVDIIELFLKIVEILGLVKKRN